MIKIFFCFCIGILCSKACFSQQKIDKIKVSWNLFQAKKPPGAKYPAFTSYKFNLKTKLIKAVGNILNLNFEVIFKIDSSRSYMEARRIGVDLDLLDHEQGHADIGIVYARKLSTELRKATFYQNGYNEKITKIFNQVNDMMLKANANYDEQTNHGTNTIEQSRWRKNIEKQLIAD